MGKLQTYRYGYQGEFSEEDEETGWNSFELRNYDSKIGRWLSPDPARQFASPYNGMGNNPINQLDPDGAFSGPGIWLWFNEIQLGIGIAKGAIMASQTGLAYDAAGMVTFNTSANVVISDMSREMIYGDFAGHSFNAGYDSDNFLFEDWTKRSIMSVDISVATIQMDEGYIGGGAGIANPFQGGAVKIDAIDIVTTFLGYTRGDIKSYFGHKYGGESFNELYIKERNGRFFYGSTDKLELFKIYDNEGLQGYGTQSYLNNREQVLNDIRKGE